jgi:hypothetical protein
MSNRDRNLRIVLLALIALILAVMWWYPVSRHSDHGGTVGAQRAPASTEQLMPKQEQFKTPSTVIAPSNAINAGSDRAAAQEHVTDGESAEALCDRALARMCLPGFDNCATTLAEHRSNAHVWLQAASKGSLLAESMLHADLVNMITALLRKPEWCQPYRAFLMAGLQREWEQGDLRFLELDLAALQFPNGLSRMALSEFPEAAVYRRMRAGLELSNTLSGPAMKRLQHQFALVSKQVAADERVRADEEAKAFALRANRQQFESQPLSQLKCPEVSPSPALTATTYQPAAPLAPVRPIPDVQLPIASKLEEVRAELSARAQAGEVGAACQLARQLYICELQADEVRRGRREWTDSSFCSGTSHAAPSEHFRWLLWAALLGERDAQITALDMNYVFFATTLLKDPQLFETFRISAPLWIEQFQSEADRDVAKSLLGVHTSPYFYANGWTTFVEPDPVEALALLLATQKCKPEDLDRKCQGERRAITRATRALNAEQHQNALVRSAHWKQMIATPAKPSASDCAFGGRSAMIKELE